MINFSIDMIPKPSSQLFANICLIIISATLFLTGWLPLPARFYDLMNILILIVSITTVVSCFFWKKPSFNRTAFVFSIFILGLIYYAAVFAPLRVKARSDLEFKQLEDQMRRKFHLENH